MADKVLRALKEIIQGKTGAICHFLYCNVIIFIAGYSLVIVCSSHDEEKCPLISKLHAYRRPYVVPKDIGKYKEYIEKHFINKDQPSYQEVLKRKEKVSNASLVDPDRYKTILSKDM